MAKTESTAVNQLIASVQTGRPEARPNKGDDLFAGPAPSPRARLSPPRMTATIPPLRGAGAVDPLPRHRTPSGTSEHRLPRATGQAAVRVTTARAQQAVIPPLAAPPVHARQPVPTLPMPPTTRLPAGLRPMRPDADDSSVVVRPVKARPATVDAPGDHVATDDWFEASRSVDRLEQSQLTGEVEIPWDHTQFVKLTRRNERIALIKKLIAPTIALAVVGVMVGGYFAFNGEGGKKHAAADKKVAVVEKSDEPAAIAKPSHESSNAATASAGAALPEPPRKGEQEVKAEAAREEVAAAAKPAPAPAPAVAEKPSPAPVAKPAPAHVAEAVPSGIQEVKTQHGVVRLVDIRLDSKPEGATVMLVDQGHSSLLGTTPMSAAVDASRSYDVVFTIDGRTPSTVHLDPSKTHRLSTSLFKGAPAVKAAPAAAPAPVAARKKPAPKAAAIAPLADPGFGDAIEAPKPAEAKPAGNGTLMVSSKPPCSIVVDGKDTGLRTPQRALPLPAGSHQVTFINTDEKIEKTVTVTITADKSTKLIENLMQ